LLAGQVPKICRIVTRHIERRESSLYNNRPMVGEGIDCALRPLPHTQWSRKQKQANQQYNHTNREKFYGSRSGTGIIDHNDTYDRNGPEKEIKPEAERYRRPYRKVIGNGLINPLDRFVIHELGID